MIEATYTVDPPCPARLCVPLRFASCDYVAGADVAVVAVHTYPGGIVGGDCVVDVRQFGNGQVYGPRLPVLLSDVGVAARQGEG